MTYLGIDYGTKRIGLAIASDEITIPAPLDTIANTGDIVAQLKTVIAEEQAEKVVLGIPVSMEGHEGAFAKKVRAFGKELKKELDIPVIFVNEVLSTAEARARGATDLDAAAAAIILEDYLELAGEELNGF